MQKVKRYHPIRDMSILCIGIFIGQSLLPDDWTTFHAAVGEYAFMVEPQYHQPTDTIEHISKEKLQQAASIVGGVAYQIARPDTPALDRAHVAPATVDYNFENRPVD